MQQAKALFIHLIFDHFIKSKKKNERINLLITNEVGSHSAKRSRKSVSIFYYLWEFLSFCFYFLFGKEKSLSIYQTKRGCHWMLDRLEILNSNPIKKISKKKKRNIIIWSTQINVTYELSQDVKHD